MPDRQSERNSRNVLAGSDEYYDLMLGRRKVWRHMRAVCCCLCCAHGCVLHPVALALPAHKAAQSPGGHAAGLS